ncbi:hypothetical protein CVT26_011136 [Gymnopilus dilepis]|uniref:Uncharacterized protein n=1 Tax=Gymnopilus dilepis TaxID=231916 RepID=A0A409VYX3_9AGAR|nr:hypothetical protein CVT26_011136 [Gymnopilus dilepis]
MNQIDLLLTYKKQCVPFHHWAAQESMVRRRRYRIDAARTGIAPWPCQKLQAFIRALRCLEQEV